MFVCVLFVSIYMLSFGLHILLFESSNVSLKNYSVANDVTPEMTDEINYATGGADK